MTKLLSDEELRAKFKPFTHQESHACYCPQVDCECAISSEYVSEMVELFNSQKRLYAEMAISLDAEALMRVGNKSDNHRSHVPAYKAIIEEQRARIK